MNKLPFSARPLERGAYLHGPLLAQYLAAAQDPFRRPAFRVGLLDLTRQQQEKRPRDRSHAVQKAPGGNRATPVARRTLSNSSRSSEVSAHLRSPKTSASSPQPSQKSVFSPSTCSSTVWSFERRRSETFRSLPSIRREWSAFYTPRARPACAVAKGWAKA